MKNKIDIKYIDVPNICFSLTEKYDDREKLYSTQRIERGFDDSETWSLTDTICHFITPRLQRFKECANYIPSNITKEEWNEILDKMLLSFNLISRDNGSRIWSDEESKQINEGLDLFREWFMELWW
jgi:hypothetical protein